MALRLLEIAAAGETADRIAAVVGELLPDTRIWVLQGSDEVAFLRFLVDSRQVETLSDRLQQDFGTQPEFRLVSLPVEATVPPIGEGAGMAAGAAAQREAAPSRISREELLEDLLQASRVTGVYLVMVALSTLVAAVGLLRDDTAIVIGAMVIAPLLGPNIALSLAIALRERGLAYSSVRAIIAGVATAAVLSLAIGLMLGVDPAAEGLHARTNVEWGDIILALAAGGAGALAFTSGVPAVVVGVMVAVALLPPLVVAGLLAGAGHTGEAVGAVLLGTVNVTCINLAAVTTFLLQRVGPRQ